MRLLFKYLSASIIFSATPGFAYAEYCATGKFEASVCKGFVIESCSFQKIAALKEDGKLYHVNQCYSSVSEYNSKTGRCWINAKSKGWGLISAGVNAATQPVFVKRNPDGSFDEIDAEFITFPCVKR